MRRREFVALLGGAAAWPFAARAQQSIGGHLQGQRHFEAQRFGGLEADDQIELGRERPDALFVAPDGARHRRIRARAKWRIDRDTDPWEGLIEK